MSGGNRVRWAVAASAGAHALLLIMGFVLTRRAPAPPTPPAGRIDTRVTFDADRRPDVRESVPVPFTPDPGPPDPGPPDPPAMPPRPDPQPSPAPAADVPAMPQVISVPSVLPPDLLARVRRAAGSPAYDPSVKPVVAVSAPPTRPAARPAHGVLAAGQRVVYLLDASGSMGEWGKFDAARDATAATLALQPATVDVKVVVYSTTAEVVTPPALAARTPAGRGDHLAGLRVALEQSPDFVVWFTDAHDLPTAAARTAVRRAGRPVTLVVARVGADGVGTPVELR